MTLLTEVTDIIMDLGYILLQALQKFRKKKSKQETKVCW
jgi:hypothetical protein